MTEIFDGFFWEIFPMIFADIFVISILLIGGLVLKIKDKYDEKKKSNNTKSDKVCSI